VNARLSLALFAAAACACSAEVEVQTDPQSVSVPVLSAVATGYAEVAIDMPKEIENNRPGAIVIETVEGAGSGFNPASGTDLSFSLRVVAPGDRGQAVPGGLPAVYTDANLPEYFSRSLVLVGETVLAPQTPTPVTVSNPSLGQAVQQDVMWLIVSNKVSRVGFGQVFPLELQLNNLTFHVIATKSFEGASNGADVLGL
jgi:hypothetical protein